MLGQIRERFEEATLAGDGTLLIVEHDRTFVERVATEVVDLTTPRG